MRSPPLNLSNKAAWFNRIVRGRTRKRPTLLHNRPRCLTPDGAGVKAKPVWVLEMRSSKTVAFFVAVTILLPLLLLVLLGRGARATLNHALVLLLYDALA